MANWDLLDLAQELSDLEVALLLCLVDNEHPLIETADANIGDVAKELALICANTFNFTCAVLDCSSATSVEDFWDEILVADSRKSQVQVHQSSRSRAESSSNISSLQSPQESRDRARSISANLDVVNVVIAKNFDHVDEYIQMQALELMRSKKTTTPKSTLHAPTEFLFVPVVARNSDQSKPGLNLHLNDHLFISHFHEPENGYAYLEDGNDWYSDGQLSSSSVIHKPANQALKQHAKIPQPVLDKSRQAGNAVTVSADVIRYQQDIIVFLRLSRAVAGGVSTKANYHFSRFSKLLAALHGIDYCTPSITALAAKKVFRHRIVVAKPEDDRSLQYGSDFKTVSRVLAHVSPEEILDSVLALEAPL